MDAESGGELLYAGSGFEIHRIGNEVWLVDRGLWRMGMVMGVVAAGCLLLGAIGLWLLVDREAAIPTASAVPGAACLAGGAVAAGAFTALTRGFRFRQERPVVELANAVVIDQRRHLLRTAQGAVLSSVSSVKIAVRISWWDGSRGIMRDVVLRWPGGRRVVFKTASRRKARAVAMSLHAELLRRPT